MGQIRLFVSDDNHKIFKIQEGRKETVVEGYAKQDFICPLTGKSFKKRTEFWDYMKATNIQPSKMTYDRQLNIENEENISKLLDKTHLEELWLNYFGKEFGSMGIFNNLVGQINLELYIILLKVYRGDMDIDECISNVNENNKTGIKRDIKDQFYTNRNVSAKCIDIWLKHITDKNANILEPSAGDGSFSDYFIENNYNIDSYDIEPKKNYIMQENFLKLDTTDFKNMHTIGNPPFGRQSSLAKQFIKKCATFSDSISFILPKSFKKESYQKSFPLNFHLEYETDLDKNSFIIDGKIHNVPCVFQIWINKPYNRYVEEKPKEKGFKFIKKPSLEVLKVNDEGKAIKRKNIFIEKPDFGILRAGGGDTCGRISKDYEDGIKCYPEAWLFIKLDDGYDKNIFYEKYKEINWIDDSNVGARSISKPIFIKGINKLLENMINSYESSIASQG